MPLCCQPCTPGLGMSHSPAAAGLTSPCPCSQSQRRGRGHGPWPSREGDGGSEGIPQLQPWGTPWILSPGRRGADTTGASQKELNPSQRCGEQAGTSWAWGAQSRGQLHTKDDLQTHTASPGSQGKHPQPPSLPSLCTPSPQGALWWDRGGMFSPGLFS